MVQSTPGVNSSTEPFSMRTETARSSVALVAKGHTGALFLLIAIFGAALEKGLGDMKRRAEKKMELKKMSSGPVSEMGREGTAS